MAAPPPDPQRRTHLSNPDSTSSSFAALHHLSLVVEDLDRSVERLERLGFGRFIADPSMREYVRLEVPDRGAVCDLRIMVCEIGPVALEVIEAKDSATVYGDFLRRRGEGIFHLGFQGATGTPPSGIPSPETSLS